MFDPDPELVPQDKTRPLWLQQALAWSIPKLNLKHGQYYIGKCRNAGYARWDADKQEFVYWHTKFTSTFIERIKHPEDYQGFDVFEPKDEFKEIPLDV